MTQTLSREPSDPLFQPINDSDPATPGDPLSRLRFHYGQCLSAEDFEAEQRYFVLRQRLHNALLHGVGTVWGLAIRRQDPPPEGGDQLICEPGMAIDPLGREIWVPQPLCLDLAALETRFWAQLASTDPADPESPKRRAYVVLRYQACLSEAVPVIPLPCGDDQDGLAASRLRDSFRLCLEAEAPPDPYATVRDISRRLGSRERRPGPRRGDRWRAADGTIWIYDQPRNADGTWRADDPSTPARESELRWRIDPSVAPASPGGPLPVPAPLTPPQWQGWRQGLLDHALNEPIAGVTIAPGPLERFWSGADDAALLLASLDLEATNLPSTAELQPVRLLPATAAASNPDNGVRAVLPSLQAVADLAFGIRLEGTKGQSKGVLQARLVSVHAIDTNERPTASAGGAAATLIEVGLSNPLVADAPELAKGIRLLCKPSASGRWQTVKPETIRLASSPEGSSVQLLVKPAWSSRTPFQVVLSGTGTTALLSDTPRPMPMAGVVGEDVPPGTGRDAHLFGTYTPPTP